VRSPDFGELHFEVYSVSNRRRGRFYSGLCLQGPKPQGRPVGFGHHVKTDDAGLVDLAEDDLVDCGQGCAAGLVGSRDCAAERYSRPPG
jgi:hypothetical protein